MTSAAFPTLFPTASTFRKSFFDASSIGTISSSAYISIYPVKERKGKSRNFFTVHQTLIEIHKSQKDAKNKKAAKYLVDLGDVFNVSMQNEPIQIKEDCISIMDPNSTFFIRPLESDYDLQAWFDLILERSRECRSTKLLRPVFREEYFESSWDIQIVKRPKLRRNFAKKRMETQIEDLAEKKPQMLGHRRLCICPSSFLIFSIGCKPSAFVDTPFDKSNFVDLSLNVISNYGTQERYFFVRIGRCSEIGSGELWMATENGASAKSMHERISEINQRESERRRAHGIKMNLPTISSSVLKSRAHRERSQTQNMHKVGSRQRIKEDCEKINNKQQEMRKVSTNSNRVDESNKSRQQMDTSNNSLSLNSQLESRHQSVRMDSASCLQSIPERLLFGESTANSSKKNSLVNMLASRIGSKMSAGSVGKQITADVKMDQLTAPCSPSSQSIGKFFELDGKTGSQNNSLLNLTTTLNQSARNSIVNSVLGLRLNRRNSITNIKALNNQQTTSQKSALQQSSALFSTQPSYDCAEDYMTYDADEKNQFSGHSLKLGSVGSRVSVSALARGDLRKNSGSFSACVPVTMRQFSTSSAIGISSPDPHDHPTNKTRHYQTNFPGDYIEMNMDNNQMDANIPKPSSAEPVFALQDVQSYISNSSESCWTPNSSNTNRSAGGEIPSTAANAPRAYSLGSRPANIGCSSASNSKAGSSEIERVQNLMPSQQQLLHPSANNSPPNYLKKTILGQTVKNMMSKEIIENLGNKNEQNKQEENQPNKKEKEENMDELMNAEVRKRAYSVGSKTWVKPFLKKLSTAIQQNKQQQDDDFGTSDGDNSRRNTYGAKSMGSCSGSCYPQSMEDHIEIDFDRDESPSMDSLASMNSRNSSLGKQVPLGIRSALDSLSHYRGLEKTKGSEAVLTNQQMKRKQTIPEMSQPSHQQQVTQSMECSTTRIQSSPDNAHAYQLLLHPNRRSTCDTSTLHLKVREKKTTHKKRSPPRTSIIANSPFPSSHSTSSGITSFSHSTTNNELSLATTSASGTKHTKEPIITEDEDDYVLLSTPKIQQKQQHDQKQQQQLSVRFIGTILESSSPCSSLSSDGEGKRRTTRFTTRENSSKSETDANFLDAYSPLIVNDKKRTSPPRTLANERTQTRLSISSKSSRSSSQSPHHPRRKFSTQIQCTPVRSYFPVEQFQQNKESPSPTTRRKTLMATFYQRERMSLANADAGNSSRKFTCPNLATLSKKEWKHNMEKKQKKQECDYALISEQEPKLDGN